MKSSFMQCSMQHEIEASWSTLCTQYFVSHGLLYMIDFAELEKDFFHPVSQFVN